MTEWKNHSNLVNSSTIQSQEREGAEVGSKCGKAVKEIGIYIKQINLDPSRRKHESFLNS